MYILIIPISEALMGNSQAVSRSTDRGFRRESYVTYEFRVTDFYLNNEIIAPRSLVFAYPILLSAFTKVPGPFFRRIVREGRDRRDGDLSSR